MVRLLPVPYEALQRVTLILLICSRLQLLMVGFQLLWQVIIVVGLDRDLASS